MSYDDEVYQRLIRLTDEIEGLTAVEGAKNHERKRLGDSEEKWEQKLQNYKDEISRLQKFIGPEDPDCNLTRHELWEQSKRDARKLEMMATQFTEREDEEKSLNARLKDLETAVYTRPQPLRFVPLEPYVYEKWSKFYDDEDYTVD